MEAPGPVLVEICFGDSFEFDFIFMPILFPGLGVDDLRFVEVGGRGEDLLVDLLRVPRESEPVDCVGDEPCKHLELNEKI